MFLCSSAAKERAQFCQILSAWQSSRPVRPTNDDEGAVAADVSWPAAPRVWCIEHLVPAGCHACLPKASPKRKPVLNREDERKHTRKEGFHETNPTFLQ